MQATNRCFFIVTALTLAATAILEAQPVPERTRVLVLYAHDRNAPGVVAFTQGLQEVVRTAAPHPVEFFDELLDLVRFADADRWPQLGRSIAEKFAAIGPDAIVAEGSQALEFALEQLRVPFPDVPIVYGGAFEPVLDFSSLPANVTGRRQPLPFAGTLDLARRLQPDAERVVLVAGAAAMDSVLLTVALPDMRPLLGGMTLTVLQDWSFESLIDSLRQMPPRTIVVFSSIRRDQLGRVFNTGDLIASFTRLSSAPVYGIARNWVGDGVVGGSVIDFADDGTRTGHLLVDVLRRAPGDPLPEPEVAATPLVVDWRQLQRWGLSEALLPPGTEVLFRELSAWKRYRAWILAVAGVLCAQSLLIALLLLERRRRIGAQKALQEQMAFELLIAQLTTDSVRLAPNPAPEALAERLALVASFAGANAAVLIADSDVPGRQPTRLTWPAANDAGDDTQTAAPLPAPSRLVIPLIVEGTGLGALELERPAGATWPVRLVTQLDAAAEFLAVALARARATRALEQSRGQVAHMARAASLGELAAVISHELRQPLTAIRANAEAGVYLLAHFPPDVGEAREAFRDIVNDDQRAVDIIEQVRTMLRKEDATTTAVDLNGVCRRAAHFLQRDAALRGAHLDLALAPQVPPVSGDPVQLQQVILNLALNAIDAVQGSKQGSHVTLGTMAGSGEVEIFVRDSGPGLADDVQSRLFEPFFSTKTQGLGMGLAIVRTIVERHHGRIFAENAVDGGALFRVHLPAADITAGACTAEVV